MDVLICGGTRFVGYFLAWRLLAAGHRVTLFNRGTRPDPFGDRVERLRGDRNTDDVHRLLAGRSFDAVVDFSGYYGKDLLGVLRALANPGHYVFISSGQVYLVREGCPVPARETDYDGPLMPEPEDPADREQWEYGMGKRDCEDVLVAAEAAGRVRATRLRMPMIHGPRDPHGRLDAYLWRMLDGGPLLVPTPDRPCRHVYGPAVAKAIARLLGEPAAFGKAYNLCQDEAPTLRELLALLARAAGASPRLVPVSADDLVATGLRPRDVSPFSTPWMSRLDPTRAQAELGFEQEPLAQCLAVSAMAFLSHPPAEPPPGYDRRDVELALAATLERRPA